MATKKDQYTVSKEKIIHGGPAHAHEAAEMVILRALRDRGYQVDDKPAASVNSPSRVTYRALLPLRRDVDYYQLMLDRIYLQSLVSNDPALQGHSVELETMGYLNGETRYYLALFDPAHKNVCEVLMWPALCDPPLTRADLKREELDRAEKDRRKFWTPLH